MGSGSFDDASMKTYARSKGRFYDDTTKISTGQNMFTERKLHDSLNPYKVIRECCDSAEHPATVPVILALDVTGSMGAACQRTAQALGVIMTDLYKNHKDIEFLMMAIGDLAYDKAPIQASQFESDIRIAEAIDNIYFEGGGGGNSYESYTAAWYFGLHHTKLDCWNRGQKGIIITLGDEPLNPYLPAKPLSKVLGDSLQADVDTGELYAEVCKKFDIFHIGVDDHNSSFSNYKERIERTFGEALGDHYKTSTIAALPNVIASCVDIAQYSLGEYDVVGADTSQASDQSAEVQINPSTGAISW